MPEGRWFDSKIIIIEQAILIDCNEWPVLRLLEHISRQNGFELTSLSTLFSLSLCLCIMLTIRIGIANEQNDVNTHAIKVMRKKENTKKVKKNIFELIDNLLLI